jgi:membrane-associated phospholipid phosphatase
VYGDVQPVHRTIAGMWGAVGIEPAKALFENHGEFYNQEAAIPSLHAAYPMLLLLFFWGAGRWARVGLLAYALAMAFTLVYTGEHYVADIVIGWVYAAAVFAAVSWARRRRARRRSPPAHVGPLPEPPGQDVLGRRVRAAASSGSPRWSRGGSPGSTHARSRSHLGTHSESGHDGR